jgi:hypothetical protein
MVGLACLAVVAPAALGAEHVHALQFDDAQPQAVVTPKPDSNQSLKLDETAQPSCWSVVVDEQQRVCVGLTVENEQASPAWWHADSEPRIVIVGSSGGLIGSGLGPAIDAYDVVMRCNCAPHNTFKPDVGSRTTLRVTNEQVFLTLEENDQNTLPALVNLPTLEDPNCSQAVLSERAHTGPQPTTALAAVATWPAAACD